VGLEDIHRKMPRFPAWLRGLWTITSRVRRRQQTCERQSHRLDHLNAAGRCHSPSKLMLK
jgi:hypothetical protein